ncbi:MAG: PaaI family thioesterase [Oligoflexia bacterium]|nr:PaaI family thioesterase [Oligoflexia bacterium]
MKKKGVRPKKSALGLVFENYQRPDEFGRALGYRVASVDREKLLAMTELRIRKAHLSLAGRVHGGVVSAFLDAACGAAVFSTMGPRDYASTVELKVNYLKPLFLGDRLRAETRVVFRGKKLCVVHGLVYRNEEPEPVSMATGTFYVVAAENQRKRSM